MSQFRREPGEWMRLPWKHGRTLVVTKSGHEIARISPAQDTVIESDGTIRGEAPVTFRRDLGGYY